MGLEKVSTKSYRVTVAIESGGRALSKKNHQSLWRWQAQPVPKSHAKMDTPKTQRTVPFSISGPWLIYCPVCSGYSLRLCPTSMIHEISFRSCSLTTHSISGAPQSYFDSRRRFLSTNTKESRHFSSLCYRGPPLAPLPSGFFAWDVTNSIYASRNRPLTS